MDNKHLKQFYFKDTTFANLMQRRIFNILLVANRYDAFILEDDGRVDEQIFFEYMSLNLSYPPRFTQVDNTDLAFQELKSRPYDLIITMPAIDNSSYTFTQAKEIKKAYPHIPIVVLTPFSGEISRRMAKEDLSAIDYVFSWLGNADLLLAIIKLLEDKMNVQNDVESVGVQTILLVEDSVRFYSSVLPHLYRLVLTQSQMFSTEALNEHEQMLRMRGRPKILLARSYEEAVELYDRYRNNMLGIVTDVSFTREQQRDPRAGFLFCEYVRSKDPFVPIIIESSDVSNAPFSVKYQAAFLDKTSKKLPVDLRKTIMRYFGFGDFEFINPQTGEILLKVKNLHELQQQIYNVPDDSLYYHGSHNHISRWLYSRALFPLAEYLRAQQFTEPFDGKAARKTIIDAIGEYRRMKNKGVVAIFKRERYDLYSNFARIGEGSLGGKGRGLAFIDQLIKKNPDVEEINGALVSIPKTVVLCTDVFDQFMESNNLYQIALSDMEDEKILSYFLRARLPDHLVQDFFKFFDVVRNPIAIRSSSLLEDSHYQPFAGVYNTYMIPYIKDKYEMLRLLSNAIKGVYASVFFSDSKAYMTATSNLIDQEKMAIILQEVVGDSYGRCFYPSFSGVARSLNYYPINDEKPEDGVADIAIGLGKYIVDGGVSLRFSPKHPNNVLQTSTLDLALSETQTRFYCLDLSQLEHPVTTDDSYNLLRLPLSDAEANGSLGMMVSTYNHVDQTLSDGYYEGGSRNVATFANILKYETFPLAKILDKILALGSQAMGRHIEIEFAVTLPHPNSGDQARFYWLQIRPIVDMKVMMDDHIDQVNPDSLILYSDSALGHGIMDNIDRIVYVKEGSFSMYNNSFIAREVERLNRQYLDQEKNYILIGPGRWGSNDTALGIPVKWPHISAAKVIVETTQDSYYIEPSQGTHFFQNLTSFGAAYFTVNPKAKQGILDLEYLNSLPTETETKFLRVVRFENPLVVKVNGKKGIGIVMKPNIEIE